MRQWVTAGLFRNYRGVSAAFFATWFGVPLALVLAMVGGVFGAVVGIVNGTLSLGTTAHDIPVVGSILTQTGGEIGGVAGGMLGFLVGAVSGFLAGLVLPWIGLFQADPLHAVGALVAQLVVGLFVGVLYVLYRIAFEGWILRISGARRMSRREEALLMPIVQDCAGRLGLRGLPRVLLNDDRTPNASAWTRHLVINQGLLDEFNYDREAIAGVICHELTHWNNADAIASAFVRGVSLPLYLLYAAATAVMTRFRHPVVHLLVWLVFWPVLVTFRYFIVPMQAADSREAEYRGDRAAAQAGHRAGMRLVLARLRRSFDGSRDGWDLAICATHPPNELRLEAIEEPGRDYPLPDSDAPARPIPVAMISTLDRD